MTLFWFLLTIAIVVVIHELGHFAIARLFNIRILKFSIGFGRAIWSTTSSRTSTEWAVGWVPLGGYVQMLDSRDRALAPHEKQVAFDHKPVWQRMLVVLAGPAANFVLALGLYVVSGLMGWQDVPVVLGDIPANSAAAQAGLKTGDKIESANGFTLVGWRSLEIILSDAKLSGRTVSLTIRRGQQTHNIDLPAQALSAAPLGSRLSSALGASPLRYSNTIEQLAKNSPATKGGLQRGDAILALDGVPVKSGLAVPPLLLAAGGVVRVEVERRGKRFAISLSILQTEPRRLGVMFGVANAADLAPKLVKFGGFSAVRMAELEAWTNIRFSFSAIWALLSGELSLKEVAGPLGIAQGASQSAAYGLDVFLRFIALISISIGVLNLLPVPILDGGHFMYHTAELIKGSPVSFRAQAIGQMVGLVVLILLTVLALNNDLHRLLANS